MVRGKKEIVNCKGCLNDFNALSIKVRAGKAKYCTKECYASFRLRNKKDEKYMNKVHQKKNKYGVDEQQYIKLMEVTNCQICDKLFKDNNEKCIDHCHTTNIVRGVLCNNCNKGLGMFLDNRNYLQAAIAYLKLKG